MHVVDSAVCSEQCTLDKMLFQAYNVQCTVQCVESVHTESDYHPFFELAPVELIKMRLHPFFNGIKEDCLAIVPGLLTSQQSTV